MLPAKNFNHPSLGMPPTPNARSKDKEPVGTTSTSTFGASPNIIIEPSPYFDLILLIVDLANFGNYHTADYGDAPRSEPIHDGRQRRRSAPDRRRRAEFGTAVDADLDGQPNALALGDDLGGADDEDGVVFTTPVIPGETAD